MVNTFGNNIINAYTGGVQVKYIYSNGVQVWPVSGPTPPGPTPTPANNEIFYTSTDETVVLPNSSGIPSGLNIVSNIYTPGVGGVITFGGDLGATWNGMFMNAYKLRTIVLPESVTIIKMHSFNGCDNLESLNIPQGVTEIQNYAFDGCLNLQSLTIPASTVTIEEDAFLRTSLQSLSVDSGNQVYDSRNNCNAIIETSTNTLFVGCNNTVIPSSVSKIGHEAFFGRTMSSITVPSSVTEIGVQAFSYCYGLTQISLPGVTLINSGAFGNCNNLVSVSVPNLLYLGYPLTNAGVFENCTSLTSITLPSYIQLIYTRAFKGCVNLSEVIINATTPPQLRSEAFDNTSPNLLIKVPAASLNAYQIATGWSDYASQIVAQS